MKPLQKLYTLRVFLGIFAALLSIIYGLAVETNIEQPSINTFINSLSLAVIVYLLSYYLIKMKLKLGVENNKKILTTGIGVYFISWIFFWVLLYTLIIKI